MKEIPSDDILVAKSLDGKKNPKSEIRLSTKTDAQRADLICLVYESGNRSSFQYIDQLITR